MLKVWYPCVADAEGDAEMLWADVIHDKNTPSLMRLFIKCITTKSTTIANADFDITATAPLVVYNHGMISFASENTSLMEELASHGYIVLAIQHAEQLQELQGLSKLQSKEKKQKDARIARKLKKSHPAERAELASEYYAASTNTNQITIERSLDTSFVLDHVAEIFESIPNIDVSRVNTSTVHLLGFSIGGAVATETAARDSRTASVVNMDGGMHGTVDRGSANVPYLMMYSSVNQAMNELLLPKNASRIVSPQSAHLNFHDLAMLLPLLRYIGVLGKTHALEFIQNRNATVREFVSRHTL